MESRPLDSSCPSSDAYSKQIGNNAKQMRIHQHCQRRRPTISSQSHNHSNSRMIHSVRHKKKNPTMKNLIKANKLPVAPLPPVPKRIYTVNSADFKSVVQKLTGATRTRRLQRLAPPPLEVAAAAAAARSCLTGPATIPPEQHPSALHDVSAMHASLMFETLADADRRGYEKQMTVMTDPEKVDYHGDRDENAFGWSFPQHYSSYGSCSGDYHFLSPGTMASLDPIMNSVLYS